MRLRRDNVLDLTAPFDGAQDARSCKPAKEARYVVSNHYTYLVLSLILSLAEGLAFVIVPSVPFPP